MDRRAVILTVLFGYLFTDMLLRHMPLDWRYVLVVVIVGAGAYLVAWKRAAWPIPMKSALTIYLLGMWITAALSVSVELSAYQFLLTAIYVLTYIVVLGLARVWMKNIFLDGLRNASWVLIVAVAFITLYSATTGGALRPPAANVLAALFNLLLLPTLADFFVERPGNARVAWFLAALALVFITASRGGWLGLTAGLLVLATRRWERLSDYWSRVRPFFFPTVVALVAFAAVWQIASDGHSTRRDFWTMAAAITIRYPYTGSGPGTFNLFWSQLYPPPFWQAMHAHSIIFNTAAEQGLLGLLTLAVMAVALLRAAWRDDGLLAAVVAFGVHNLVDSLDKAPAVMIVLAVLLGSRLAQHEFVAEAHPATV